MFATPERMSVRRSSEKTAPAASATALASTRPAAARSSRSRRRSIGVMYGRCYHAGVLLPAPVELACSACGARQVEHGRQLIACPACGGFLDVAAPRRWPHARADAAETPPRWVDPARRGVWRYRPLLPLRDERALVSLGEGATPTVPLPRWGEAVGAPRASAKLEHLAPTGSFKDRGMTLVVSRA